MSMIRKRTKPYINPVSPAELRVQDKQWLDKALKKDYYGTTISEVLHKAITGYAQIWRLGDYEGVIVSEIIAKGGHYVLVISHVAGKGFFKKIPQAVEFFLDYGRKAGCKYAEMAGMEPGTKKVYSKHFTEVATIYIKEL